MSNSAVVGILRALLVADTAEFEQGMKRAADSMKVWSKDLNTIGQQATKLGQSLTKTLTLPLLAIGAGSAKLAMDFESSFQGVRKTVEATDAEFDQMAQAFRNLAKEIPVNVNELNRLGEAAGALGIPKEKIVDFVRVMALLGATTNVSADQAAESIAKIQNIFGAAGKDTDRFASTLVDLGNKSAATESQILEMATRIAGAGNAIGISQGQVLAFASALSSVGIEAEMGGSAISRVFIDIASAVSKGGEAVAGFAAVADLSIKDFSKLFKEDAATATEKFISGLGRIKARGGDLIGTLEKLGITEIRLRDTLLRAAGAGDLLKESLDLQAGAWQKNSALTDEAAIRFGTAENRLTVLWNRVKDVGISLGKALVPAIDFAIHSLDMLVPLLDGAVRLFGKLPAPVQAGAIGLLALAAAAGPVLIVFGQIATALASLSAAFAAKGLATRALTMANGVLTTSMLLVARSIAVVGTAMAAWQVGKWIGEVTTLTDMIGRDLAKALYGVSAAEYDAMNARRKGIEASQEQTTETKESIAVAKALEDAQKAVAEAETAGANANKELAAWTAKQTANSEEAKKAAKEQAEAEKKLAEAIEAKRRVLEQWGLITQPALNAQLAEFQEALDYATKEAGVGLTNALRGLLPKLEALRVAAKASGLPLGDLTEIIGELKTKLEQLDPAPTLNAFLNFKPTAAIAGLHALGVESFKATAETIELQDAYTTLGMEIPAVLKQAAYKARLAYEVMLRSGKATKAELAEAAKKLGEAEARAAGVTQVSWQSSLSSVVSAFDKLANIAGGSMSGVSRAIGTAWASIDQMRTSMGALSSTFATTAKGFATNALAFVTIAGQMIGLVKQWNSVNWGKAGDTIREIQALGEQPWFSSGVFRQFNEAQLALLKLEETADGVFKVIAIGGPTGAKAIERLKIRINQFAEEANKSGGLWSKAFKDLIAGAQKAGVALDEVNAAITGQFSKIQSATAAVVSGVIKTQDEFDRLNRITLAAFNAYIAQGHSAAEAAGFFGSSIDILIAKAKEFGFNTSEAFDALSRMRELVSANQPLLDQISGLNELMTALSNVGGLTASAFADIQTQGQAAFNSLIAAGFTEREALAQLAPMLNTINALRNKGEIAIDDQTQALIDQAKKAGLIKDQIDQTKVLEDGFTKVQEAVKVLGDRLVEIFGGTVPSALEESMAALRRLIEAMSGVRLPSISGGGGGGGSSAGSGERFMPPVSMFRQPTYSMVDGGASAAMRNWPASGTADLSNGNVVIVFEQDGRRAAEFVVPHIPGVMKRLRLA